MQVENTRKTGKKERIISNDHVKASTKTPSKKSQGFLQPFLNNLSGLTRNLSGLKFSLKSHSNTKNKTGVEGEVNRMSSCFFTALSLSYG